MRVKAGDFLLDRNNRPSGWIVLSVSSGGTIRAREISVAGLGDCATLHPNIASLWEVSRCAPNWFRSPAGGVQLELPLPDTGC